MTYDREVDACSIEITNKTHPRIGTNSFKIRGFIPFGDINLDFSKNNKILEVEILDASKYLHQEVLDSAICLNELPRNIWSNANYQIWRTEAYKKCNGVTMIHNKKRDQAYLFLVKIREGSDAIVQSKAIANRESFKMSEIPFGEVHVCFDEYKKIIGIDFSHASKYLTEETLKEAVTVEYSS